VSELEEFQAGILARQAEAEEALVRGDPEPRMALWSRNDPVTLFGAAGMYESGWDALSATFQQVATWFSDVSDFRYEVELIGISGDIETSRAPFSGRKTELVLPGNKAKYRTSDKQPVFLSSSEPADVPLVKLDPGKNDRNLRVSSSFRAGPYSGSSSQRGIRSEDRVDVEAERDNSGLFRIRPRAPLAPGEYAFVITRSYGTIPVGTVYDFGID